MKNNNVITLIKALLAVSDQIRGSKRIAGRGLAENSPKWLRAGIDGSVWLTPRSSAGGGRRPTNLSYLDWKTKVQTNNNATYVEAQVTVKRERYNRLPHRPRDTKNAAKTTEEQKSSCRSFEART
ncbi:Uncharacterized protein Rs2_26611 [Raphanus sativus]|nr:Uncharacterized protein Rs2_26611 [Raphanus sativus]